jgi:hypothetical protein
MSDFNCYVSAMAPNEDVARDVCRDVFFDNPLELGETTEPGQPDSEATYVFTFWAESFADEESMDRLHDHYIGLPYPNFPIESAN